MTWASEHYHWSVRGDHYVNLMKTSPSFREKINWQAAMYSQMIHGNIPLWDTRMTDRKKLIILTGYRDAIRVTEALLVKMRAKSPATAAELRNKGAKAYVNRKLYYSEAEKLQAKARVRAFTDGQYTFTLPKSYETLEDELFRKFRLVPLEEDPTAANEITRAEYKEILRGANYGRGVS